MKLIDKISALIIAYRKKSIQICATLIVFLGGNWVVIASSHIFENGNIAIYRAVGGVIVLMLTFLIWNKLN